MRLRTLLSCLSSWKSKEFGSRDVSKSSNYSATKFFIAKKKKIPVVVLQSVAARGLLALASTRLQTVGPQFSLIVTAVLTTSGGKKQQQLVSQKNLDFESINMHELQHQDTPAAKILWKWRSHRGLSWESFSFIHHHTFWAEEQLTTLTVAWLRCVFFYFVLFCFFLFVFFCHLSGLDQNIGTTESIDADTICINVCKVRFPKMDKGLNESVK